MHNREIGTAHDDGGEQYKGLSSQQLACTWSVENEWQHPQAVECQS